MKKLLNTLGLFTRSQVKALVTQFNNELEDCKVRNSRYVADVSKAYEEKLASQPFSFDELILLWNDNQMNSFFYKLVNRLRDTPSTRPFIQRWIDRLESAKKGIQIS